MRWRNGSERRKGISGRGRASRARECCHWRRSLRTWRRWSPPPGAPEDPVPCERCEELREQVRDAEEVVVEKLREEARQCRRMEELKWKHEREAEEREFEQFELMEKLDALQEELKREKEKSSRQANEIQALRMENEDLKNLLNNNINAKVSYPLDADAMRRLSTAEALPSASLPLRILPDAHEVLEQPGERPECSDSESGLCSEESLETSSLDTGKPQVSESQVVADRDASSECKAEVCPEGSLEDPEDDSDTPSESVDLEEDHQANLPEGPSVPSQSVQQKSCSTATEHDTKDAAVVAPHAGATNSPEAPPTTFELSASTRPSPVPGPCVCVRSRGTQTGPDGMRVETQSEDPNVLIECNRVERDGGDAQADPHTEPVRASPSASSWSTSLEECGRQISDWWAETWRNLGGLVTTCVSREAQIPSLSQAEEELQVGSMEADRGDSESGRQCTH
uniref:Uncharacterized protein n=1 Tax=Chromera velia CCMP2878 TaxID=1169474 RepID=A0A0G4FDC3_9ALVE|eukprot:Cvel_3231.t1-p1 / transcript=Cvel_3231.t1 / gene=Cvel_3231 / organism=Chromera_velia_CCMP2878 / gene_product=hypothetical protein / transcript_product=hypothetical protein / location=Cvel_scaffold126:109094-110938(-) / protein_length=454 / sequence_SO=supercontig / SO=protein_coding / is_pseudo=false